MASIPSRGESRAHNTITALDTQHQAPTPAQGCHIAGKHLLQARLVNASVFEGFIQTSGVQREDAPMLHPPHSTDGTTLASTALLGVTPLSVLQLLSISPDALLVVDQAGTIAVANEQAAALFGYSLEELEGQRLEVLLPERLRAAHAAHREHYFSTLPRTRPMGVGLQLVGLRKDGTEFAVDISLRPLLLNEKLLVIGAIRDVSQQRRAEGEYAEQLQQIRLQTKLINLAHDAILVRDPLSRVLFWNRGAEELYGWSAQEALGQVAHTLLQTRFPHPLATFLDLLEQKGQWEGDLTHTSRDGRQIIVESRQVLMRDEQGQPSAILEINRDITERRELERQKDILLGMVSHELKAPITNAKFSLHLLEEQGAQMGEEQVGGWLGKIASQLDHLHHLIDDILDATALEGRVLPVHPTEFPIDELVQQLVLEFASTQPTHPLLIEGEAHSQIYADRKRTKQVLSNLLSNALKYSAPGQPVQVRAVADEQAVTVSVQDHGVGIPKQEQARIFERLVRLGSQEQAMAPGLGLGLYIAAELVKRQGGRLWVESTPGKGSTFSFTLPRHQLQGPG
jgi:PAS domain S-box-containing protein